MTAPSNPLGTSHQALRVGVIYDRASALLRLDGIVGEAFTAAGIEAALAMADTSLPLTVRINSAGGSVQEGVSIHNLIRSFPGQKTVEVVGWALSIASHIAMAGDRILIADNAMMMIHDPWLPNAAGNSRELRQNADMLDVLRDSLVRAYRRSGKSDAQIRALMAAETWFDAAMAIKEGFADGIIAEEASVPAAMAFALASFRNVPSSKGESAMPQPVNPSQSQGAAGAVSPEAAASVLAADRQRRADIRTAYAKFAAHEGVRALQMSCEDDPRCNAADAAAKLLSHLGKSSAPVAGSYVARDPIGADFDFSTDDTRLRDFREAATQALMIRNGIPVKNPSPAARDLARMSVVDMASSCLSMAGQSIRGLSAQQVLSQAGTHSTSDFPLLLAETARKSLAAGYAEENASHIMWTAEREVPDFKKQSIVSLSEAPDLQELPEHSEYKSGSFGESAESFQVKTYGRIFGLSRQALINDDLEAFTRLPQAFGAAARRREADLVYAKLTGSGNLSDGNPLFHASHGNLAASGAALDVTSLGAARAAMRLQRGIGGLAYIDPQPRILLVPVALETKGEALLSSLQVTLAGGNTESVDWIKSLTLVADPRLDAVSDKAWYLVADPKRIEGVVRAYLAGEPRPFIDDQVEFGRDTWSLKCRLDVGVGVVDFRAFYKNPGP